MFVNRHREKLINAIVFFVKNTKHCHTLKLFKLLNFLDFEHFRQTGRSVTGLHYNAFPQGPVPAELWQEITHGPKSDLAGALSVNNVRNDLTDQVLRRDLIARTSFDKKHFSKRELQIMERIAELFRDVRADDMSAVSHARGLPWGKVYQGGKGSGRPIPYELAISSDAMMPDRPGIDEAELKARTELFSISN